MNVGSMTTVQKQRNEKLILINYSSNCTINMKFIFKNTLQQLFCLNYLLKHKLIC